MKKKLIIVLSLFLPFLMTGCAKKLTPLKSNQAENIFNTKELNHETIDLQKEILDKEDRNAKRKAGIYALAINLQKFKDEHGSFPEDTADSYTKNGIFSEDLERNPLVPEYLNEVLIDPLNIEDNQGGYKYMYFSNNLGYLLYAKLEPEKNEGHYIYFCVDNYTVNGQPVTISFDPGYNKLHGVGCSENISQNKKFELETPGLMNLLKQVQTGVEIFKEMNLNNGFYPGNLMDISEVFNKATLEKYINDIYYSYYPSQNPVKYHLGIKISNESEQGRAGLQKDDDFNSKMKNYVNGFDGEDPIYDFTE